MYKFKKVDISFIPTYFNNIDDIDKQNFEVNYNLLKLKRYKHFLYKITKNEKVVGFFGMYLQTPKVCKTCLLHLNKSERGAGLGYLLQVLRILLAKKHFDDVQYASATCVKNAKVVIKINTKLFGHGTILNGNYYQFKCNINNILQSQTAKKILERYPNIVDKIYNNIDKSYDLRFD